MTKIYVTKTPNFQTPNYGIQDDRDSYIEAEASPQQINQPNSSIDDEKLHNSCCGKAGVYLAQAVKDVVRNKCNFCLGFCSITIVVLSVLACNLMINQGPLIFLTMAQQDTGQVDAIFSPAQLYKNSVDISSYQEGGYFINSTQIDELYGDQYNLAPRKDIKSRIYNGMHSGSYSDGHVLLIDTEREK